MNYVYGNGEAQPHPEEDKRWSKYRRRTVQATPRLSFNEWIKYLKSQIKPHGNT